MDTGKLYTKGSVKRLLIGAILLSVSGLIYAVHGIGFCVAHYQPVSGLCIVLGVEKMLSSAFPFVLVSFLKEAVIAKESEGRQA